MSLFWAPKDSTSYRKSVSDFLSSCLANRHWHGGYSNLGTQVRPALPNSNSIWNARTRLNEFIWTLKCFVGKKIYKFTKKGPQKKINISRYRSHKKDRKWNGEGAREREKNLPFPSPLLYLFLSRPRISFRTALCLTLRTTKKKHTEKTGTYAGYSNSLVLCIAGY